MKVIGIKHQVGTFEDKKTNKKYDFDNYYLYLDDELANNETSQYYGVCPQVVKVKASILHQVVSPDKMEKLLNRDVDFLYDVYRNVALVKVNSK